MSEKIDRLFVKSLDEGDEDLWDLAMLAAIHLGDKVTRCRGGRLVLNGVRCPHCHSGYPAERCYAANNAKE